MKPVMPSSVCRLSRQLLLHILFVSIPFFSTYIFLGHFVIMSITNWQSDVCDRNSEIYSLHWLHFFNVRMQVWKKQQHETQIFIPQNWKIQEHLRKLLILSLSFFSCNNKENVCEIFLTWLYSACNSFIML